MLCCCEDCCQVPVQQLQQEVGIVRWCALQVYYTTPVNKTEVKGFWCHPCYQDHRGERIELDGTNVSLLKQALLIVFLH